MQELESGAEWLRARLRADLHDLHPVTIQVRTKSTESVFAKLQKGDYGDLWEIEDLIAARAVLLHPTDIKAAIDRVRLMLQFLDAKNIDAGRPSDFRYQQPHLISMFPSDYIERHPEVSRVKLEIQFTTYIQHALQESTHDVIYKGERFSWREARLDGRLRGLLEIVDDVLANISNMAQVDSDPSYEIFDKRNEIIDAARSIWRQDQLPSDMRRFAITVEGLLSASGVSIREFIELCGRHCDLIEALSLSPVDKTVGVLLRERYDQLLRGIKKRRILISSELEDLVPEARRWPKEKRVVLW
ncbi:RelA/SpoT domain-containing protein [Streptomyces sp. DSM 44915]|uniref:RelA/SpoT domain-containing protein n=1 Tax=Streptomyces chisholmiae TaxID=3075540 RepID=A0ABU2JKR1_9ACTN|nr:RelA/SpoT domain-containing protein [Streptomyces sp. DSM 44915]MDT0265576.1 RelA/SpoT domain-containing protein [Streptomyces sp. DSM 44915]